MSCSSSSSFGRITPYGLSLVLGTAPSWPITLTDEIDGVSTALDITGAAMWFAVKEDATDADADALIFASSTLGSIVITDATAGEAQIDLTQDDTAETDDLLPYKRYFSYFRIQLSSGEIRELNGIVNTLAGGIEAP